MTTTEDIYNQLAASDPLTLKDLVQVVGKSDTTVRKALKTLTDEGKIIKDGDTWFVKKKAATKKDTSIAANSSRAEAQLRDTAVLECITGTGFTGISKADIATALSMPVSLVYISLWRLQRDNKIAQLPTGNRRPAYASIEAVESGKF